MGFAYLHCYNNSLLQAGFLTTILRGLLLVFFQHLATAQIGLVTRLSLEKCCSFVQFVLGCVGSFCFSCMQLVQNSSRPST